MNCKVKLVFILLTIVNVPLGAFACNCSPMIELAGMEYRVSISDMFFEGKIISVEQDSIPYKSIKVTYEVVNEFMGDFDESREVSIYFDNMTSCGVQKDSFKIGTTGFFTARKVENDPKLVSYLEANYCDLGNNRSLYDHLLLENYLKRFDNQNNDTPTKNKTH